MDSDSDIDIKVGRMSYYYQSSVLNFYLFDCNTAVKCIRFVLCMHVSLYTHECFILF